MKIVIAEKPSVAREIGAKGRKDGLPARLENLLTELLG